MDIIMVLRFNASIDATTFASLEGYYISAKLHIIETRMNFHSINAQHNVISWKPNDRFMFVIITLNQ